MMYPKQRPNGKQIKISLRTQLTNYRQSTPRRNLELANHQAAQELLNCEKVKIHIHLIKLKAV